MLAIVANSSQVNGVSCFSFLLIQPLCVFFSSPSQGGPNAPRHTQATRLHPLCVHLGHPLAHRRHPDAVRRRVHPCRGLHRAGSAVRGQEVQRLARSAPPFEYCGFFCMSPVRFTGVFHCVPLLLIRSGQARISYCGCSFCLFMQFKI